MEKTVQKTPMYAQLRDILAERIASKKMAPGASFPSERELCEEFKVSKHTVIKALTELVAKGLVKREQGRGTFVSGFTPKLGTIRFIFYRTTAELPLDNYYASVLGAVESVVAGSGFDLVLCSTKNEQSTLIGPGDAGYLLVGPVLNELARRTAARAVPVVCVDHMACPPGMGVVAFDEVASGEAAATVLLERGFKKIGYVGGYDAMSDDKREWPNSELRLKGVRIAVMKKGLEVLDAHVIRTGRQSEYIPALKNMMMNKGLPDAFVTFSDSNAEGLVNALEKLGHPIALNKVVSFSPLNVGSVLRGMTRIAGDPAVLGLEAAKMLVGAIRRPSMKLWRTLLSRRVYQETAAPVRE
jgi:DNA-binding LacI/PurR family transcriptional regulator